MNILKEVDNVHTKIILYDNHIIEFICANNHEYELADLIQNQEALANLAGNKKLLALNIAQLFTSITKDGREFLALGKQRQYLLAEAFVIKSISQKILGNFYLKVNKPKITTMLFNNKHEAIAWLLTQ